MKTYFVYILECSDKSYYTGLINNLEKRFAEHQAGFHTSYTSTRLPVKLVYSAHFNDINEAIKIEKQIKGWSRKKKEALMRGDFDSLIQLSKSKPKDNCVIGQSSTCPPMADSSD
jgi:putative endonuclease